ncbi:uncharacterized protein LOC134231123 [Saccostrea cucullata]|uniref:uncharacterized protein LOC134231123 n=1 Tax=Saccostrea cuccullata TaxID=36930 RepID=UPI002ECFC050
MVDTWDKVLNQVKPSDEISVMVSGSKREGLRLEGSDVDVMFWPNNHRVIWELSQSQYYNTHRQTLILCDCTDSPPGYTLLYLLSPSVKMNNRHYISSSIYRENICSLSKTKSVSNGPCVSGSFHRQVEYDHAHCFICDFWPPSAFSWIERCHSWPQPHVVDDIVQNGCHFVAIGHKLGDYEDHEWRISFSLAEQKLMNAMNHCQFLTYGLLKFFITEIINNEVGDKLLCSYHMKTAVFWVIQQNTIPHWCPQNLLKGFWVCFKLILKWVYEGICPNFFIPDNNMFLSKIQGDKQHQLFIRLYGLYKMGLAFLLHSSSIRSYIINVLNNPELTICTEEQTLISEIEFDRELNREIHHFDALNNFNIQQCMNSLKTINEMIVSPIVTQYQILMLQKLTASVLQNSAFILYTETYTHKNKLRYRADKISCFMLKLAAKFGCISDMLYTAVYYYKTLRYMEALSIIEMTKVTLAQPYVMYEYNVDTEMYTEAVGGQSWSTKINQAVAGNIRLLNRIHYISELIPEQQFSLKNGFPALYIPPMILLTMLEILCYRYVNTMRVQTALNDLQTLVHYDQGHLIPTLYRDISWQILGICQQVTGNLQAALYSYQQSLRQVPYNIIQTATQMRMVQIEFLA